MMSEEKVKRLMAKTLVCFRDLDFTGMDDDVRRDILSLFLDDDEKPSKNGRIAAARDIGVFARSVSDFRLEVLAMDILMSTDKNEARESLYRVQSILREDKFKKYDILNHADNETL